MPQQKATKIFFDAFSFGRLAGPPPGAIAIDDGRAPAYLAGPALFDPQVNGYGGIDFQDPGLSAAGLEHAIAELRKCGCSHILFTLVTAPPEAFADQLRRVAGFIEARARLREAILGFHLEGPFISEDQGYAGAHPAHLTRDPEWRLFARWQRAAGGRIRMITLAPEREGSLEFIARAARAGVMVALGHTNASLETLSAAARAGACIFTHLGNGCPGQIPRHDNIIQRCLALPELMASVICDGIHIPPPALGNLLRALGPGRLVLTTDAMSAAGAPPGRYRMGPIETVVGPDRVVRNPSGYGLAGSALRPIDGFYNVIRCGGLGADAAWRAWTHLRERIAPGVEAPALLAPFSMPV